ncbi:MAG: FlgO family outer membrane protein [Elusimicrobiales bacterium]
MLFMRVSLFSQGDIYDSLANELAKYAEGIKKIAVIPFSYAENLQSTKDGSVIAERLSVKLINMGRFEVIERSQLDKVLNELKLQNSGLIDATSAKELGKILGVDAIIMGTLVARADGKIEVNARIVKTDTAQAIGAAQVYVVKDWVGGELRKSTPLYTPSTPSSSYESSQTYQMTKSENEYGFFDFVCGGDKSKVDITPRVSVVKEGSGLRAKGINPFGIRIGGYGKSLFGFEFEMSYSKHQIEEQSNFPDKYLDIGVFNMYFDLLMRLPENKKFFTYLGLGLGFGLAGISSQYITDSSGRRLDESSFVFAFRFPIGLRLVSTSLSVFAEYRFGGITLSFDRGYVGEDNSVYIDNSGPAVGLGFRF